MKGHLEFPVVRVSGKYRVGKLLGCGTFGSVYLGKDIKTQREVALKVERYEGYDAELFHEYEIYREMTGCPGISKVYWYAIEGPFNVMVIDRFDISLDELVRGGPIDKRTVVSFADQMLNTLECVHARNLIHRDIKPENFMVGFDGRIYLIDFSLAQYFRDNTTHIHTPLVTGLDFVGTIRYTSINSHLGLQQTRRDDLESLGYTLLYLHHGKVPWQGISNRNPSRHRAAVLRQKQDLCKHSFEIVPSGLMKFIQYAQSLAFEDNPDYIYCHSVLDGL